MWERKGLEMRDRWALKAAIHRDQWHSLMGSMSKRHIGVGFFRNQGLRVGNPQCQSPPPPHFMYTMIRKARAYESKTPLAPRGKGYNNSRESATPARHSRRVTRYVPSTVQLVADLQFTDQPRRRWRRARDHVGWWTAHYAASSYP